MVHHSWKVLKDKLMAPRDTVSVNRKYRDETFCSPFTQLKTSVHGLALLSSTVQTL